MPWAGTINEDDHLFGLSAAQKYGGEYVPAHQAEELWGYDDSSCRAKVYYGVDRPRPETELAFGPNIADWPEQIPLPQDLLLTCCTVLYDPVTTADELIPSGETSPTVPIPCGSPGLPSVSSSGPWRAWSTWQGS